MLPDLKRLERKYAKELVVIGVHSAKFTNEKDSECIREAIMRHGIEHPVVNDSEMKIFRAYGARGWPHFSLIDPAGDFVGQTGGEGVYDLLDEHVRRQIEKHKDKMNLTPLAFTLERSKVKAGALSYPGKILATADRLFISDSNHNRIVVADHAGKVIEVIGGPDEGAKDGDFKTARFFQPQGLALKENVLYVADTENHVIRSVDLKARTVKTVAGTGKMDYRRSGIGEALQMPLSSPWDLAVDGSRLIIAMAGSHQIWSMDLEKGTVGAFSGTGRERLIDGDHATAEFNQPSGLTIRDRVLYVADSEVSGIREVDLDPKGSVRTIAGTGLFDFGDKDGIGKDVLMQHVLGVLWHQGKLYVADAYNHKIKVCDPATREVKTFLGDGKRGKEDGAKPRFYEPSGLAAWGDKLFVADQNNHSIRVCDLKTGDVSTLPIEKK